MENFLLRVFYRQSAANYFENHNKEISIFSGFCRLFTARAMFFGNERSLQPLRDQCIDIFTDISCGLYKKLCKLACIMAVHDFVSVLYDFSTCMLQNVCFKRFSFNIFVGKDLLIVGKTTPNVTNKIMLYNHDSFLCFAQEPCSIFVAQMHTRLPGIMIFQCFFSWLHAFYTNFN